MKENNVPSNSNTDESSVASHSSTSGNSMDLFVSEEEFMAEIWAEAEKEMDAYDAECDRINNRIYKAIERQIGKGFMKDLQSVIDVDGDVRGAFRLEKNPGGKFQKEYEHGCIVGYWVDQYSVGDSGDSFAGTIWVKLKDQMYLAMDYSC